MHRLETMPFLCDILWRYGALTTPSATPSAAKQILADAMPCFWAVLLAVSLVAAWLLRRKAVAGSLMVLTAAMFLGAFCMSLDWRSKAVQLPEGEVQYRAVVERVQNRGEGRKSCDLKTVSFSREYKLKAYVVCSRELRESDTLSCVSRWNEPKNFSFSDNFDYAVYLKRHGYAATTFINLDFPKSETVSKGEMVSGGTPSLRFRLLSLLLPSAHSQFYWALISAMVLGDKSQLSAEIRDEFSAAGVSHVLALSGLHVSILLGLLSLLLSRFRNWFSALIKLLFVWSFAFLTGMPISLLRVALMFTIMILAKTTNRDSNTLNTLFTAAFLILLASPQSLYDVSFQLSFTAVFFIVLVVQWRKGSKKKSSKSKSNKSITVIITCVKDILLVSLAAQIGTLPLLLYHFGQFPTYFLLSNLLIGLFATAILSLSFVTLSVALLNEGISLMVHGDTFLLPILSFCRHLLGGTASLMASFVHAIASLPFSKIENCYITLPQVFFLYLIIALLAGFFVKIKN